MASYVIATIIEGSVNKLQKCLTPSITFATIPGQNGVALCFRIWDKTKLVDKNQVKVDVVYQ